MKYHAPSGLWFPANEPRPQKMYDGLMKYIRDSDFLLSLLQKKAASRVCVQAGGHVGMWPLHLAPRFRKVYTFEPDPLAYAALVENTRNEPKIVARHAALGEHVTVQPFSFYSGRTAVGTMTEIKDEGDLTANVWVERIDDLEEDVAAIVLDVEGYEPWALRGARRTLERCRPLVMCEMLKNSKQAITDTLAEMEYLPMDNPLNPKCRDVVFAFRGKP